MLKEGYKKRGVVQSECEREAGGWRPVFGVVDQYCGTEREGAAGPGSVRIRSISAFRLRTGRYRVRIPLGERDFPLLLNI